MDTRKEGNINWLDKHSCVHNTTLSRFLCTHIRPDDMDTTDQSFFYQTKPSENPIVMAFIDGVFFVALKIGILVGSGFSYDQCRRAGLFLAGSRLFESCRLRLGLPSKKTLSLASKPKF